MTKKISASRFEWTFTPTQILEMEKHRRAVWALLLQTRVKQAAALTRLMAGTASGTYCYRKQITLEGL